MSFDLTTLIPGALELLAGGSAAQVGSAILGAQTANAAAPPATTTTLPTPAPATPTTATGSVLINPGAAASPSLHRMTATIYVDASGNIVKVSVHKRRRRRRALITPSEIGQLEGLMSVLGKGQLAKEWIATRNMGR